MEIKPYSYSKLQTYKQCPRKAKYKYIDGLPDPAGAAAVRGSRIHDSLEKFVLGTGDLDPEVPDVWRGRLKPKNDAIVRPEYKFAVDIEGNETDFDGGDVFFRGLFDNVTEYPFDNTMHLDEYKTGKPRDAHFDQLGVYARVLFVIFDDIETVKGRVLYIDHPTFKHKVLTFERGPEEQVIPKLMQPLWDMNEIIEADDIASANQTPLCGWCPYSKSKGGPCEF